MTSFQFPTESSKDLAPELQYDQAPALQFVTAPVYPFDLAVKAIEGSAKVSFLIGPKEDVLETQVIEASHPDFGLAAAAMLESWRFLPAQKSGQPSPTVFVKEVRFSADDRDSGLSDSAKQFLKAIEDKQPEIASLTELDKVPRALYQVLPFNPVKRLAQFNEESLLLEFFLDTQGKVQLPRIIEAKNPALAWSALTALARWRFEVPRKQGKPVLAKMQIPFQFGQLGVSP